MLSCHVHSIAIVNLCLVAALGYGGISSLAKLCYAEEQLDQDKEERANQYNVFEFHAGRAERTDIYPFLKQALRASKSFYEWHKYALGYVVSPDTDKYEIHEVKTSFYETGEWRTISRILKTIEGNYFFCDSYFREDKPYLPRDDVTKYQEVSIELLTKKEQEFDMLLRQFRANAKFTMGKRIPLTPDEKERIRNELQKYCVSHEAPIFYMLDRYKVLCEVMPERWMSFKDIVFSLEQNPGFLLLYAIQNERKARPFLKKIAELTADVKYRFDMVTTECLIEKNGPKKVLIETIRLRLEEKYDSGWLVSSITTPNE